MKIACLQFAPQTGDVDNNLNRADAVLSKPFTVVQLLTTQNYISQIVLP